MIRGLVNARHEAIIRLRLRGAGGVELDVDAIVDSGFTSSLTLPAATVIALGLVRQSSGTAVLADGSVRQFDSLPQKSSGVAHGGQCWCPSLGTNHCWECGCSLATN